MERKVEKSCWSVAAAAVGIFLVAIFVVSLVGGKEEHSVIVAATK